MMEYYCLSLMLFIFGGIGIFFKEDIVGIFQFILILFYSVVLFFMLVIVEKGLEKNIGILLFIVLMINCMIVLGLAFLTRYIEKNFEKDPQTSSRDSFIL